MTSPTLLRVTARGGALFALLGAGLLACSTGTVDSTGSEICNNRSDDDGDFLTDCLDPDCAADPGCAGESPGRDPGSDTAQEICDNGRDDDGDRRIDCDDSSCIGHAACGQSTEICDNGADDDGDGRTDCDDSDCLRADACRGSEVCDNRTDDDGDGRADCDDTDCEGFRGCSEGEDCDNGRDDDADGRTDCDDTDCARDPACGAEDCTNGSDDDRDRLVDCDDPDCSGHASCGDSTENCTNGRDDDGDGQTDCDDAECARSPACASSEDCDNRRDDDRDGDIDCDDRDCASDPACTVTREVCNNSRDDDGDGQTDCADTDCSRDPACATGDEVCDNSRDDDGDGAADCDDSDCSRHPSCAPPAEDCTNGRDDDGDGNVDCADSDCARNPACVEDCDNSRDDDSDGHTDCADSDCATDPACVTDEDCANHLDDDGDGWRDCDDADCADDPRCAGSDPCTSHGSCSDCVADWENWCGWCGAASACSVGWDDGPDEGTCAADWAWYAEDCTGGGGDPCTSHTTCSACTADYASWCGWCGATSSCSVGWDDGPDEGTCSADWAWYSSDCTDGGGGTDPCNANTTCDDCVWDWDNNCGWCAASSTCQAGTSAGPVSGTCPNWDWAVDSCDSGGADPCAAHGDCAACTADWPNSCGWCASTGECKAGTSSRPDEGTCSDWDWFSYDCGGTADACAGHSSCGDCTADYANWCGWCGASSTCSAGSELGPDAGSCSADWAWYASDCSASDPCAAHGDCGSCISDWDNWCGWCASTSSCAAGDSIGPDAGSCSDWDWEATDCDPGGLDPCPTHGSCGACTADYANGCGWCASTSSCSAGDAAGPDVGTCSNWDWQEADCTGGADPCAAHGSCAVCTADYANYCGWCASTGTCAVGDFGGPEVGTCSDWDWRESDCGGGGDPCASHWTCSTCTADYDNYCGWCASTGSCASGDALGPDVGTCSDWDWQEADCTGGVDPCAAHGSCSACTADYDNYCGWCATTSSCAVGDFGGPEVGTCSDWDWQTSDCGGGAGELCTDTCAYPNDGECDDGGAGSDTSLCAFGTDCTDCGVRYET